MSLLVALTLAPFPLVACGDDDDAAVENTTTTEDGATTETTSGDDTAGGGSDLADLSVRIDGDALTIAGACQGADGAVIIDTVSGPRVMVVREEGLAIRISTDAADDSGESTFVEVEREGDVQRYESVVVTGDQETEVEVEIQDSIEAELDLCPALQP